MPPRRNWFFILQWHPHQRKSAVASIAFKKSKAYWIRSLNTIVFISFFLIESGRRMHCLFSAAELYLVLLFWSNKKSRTRRGIIDASSVFSSLPRCELWSIGLLLLINAYRFCGTSLLLVAPTQHLLSASQSNPWNPILGHSMVSRFGV